MRQALTNITSQSYWKEQHESMNYQQVDWYFELQKLKFKNFNLLSYNKETEILIVGYSNPFFEYIIHRVDNIERLNLLQVKRDLLCQLKDLIYSKTQLLLI